MITIYNIDFGNLKLNLNIVLNKRRFYLDVELSLVVRVCYFFLILFLYSICILMRIFMVLMCCLKFILNIMFIMFLLKFFFICRVSCFIYFLVSWRKFYFRILVNIFII